MQRLLRSNKLRGCTDTPLDTVMLAIAASVWCDDVSKHIQFEITMSPNVAEKVPPFSVTFIDRNWTFIDRE